MVGICDVEDLHKWVVRTPLVSGHEKLWSLPGLRIVPAFKSKRSVWFSIGSHLISGTKIGPKMSDNS